MKVYAVIGKWHYEGEDCQGVWMTRAEAEQWVDEYIEARRQDGDDRLPWDELSIYAVEGNDFKTLVEYEKNMQKNVI